MVPINPQNQNPTSSPSLSGSSGNGAPGLPSSSHKNGEIQYEGLAQAAVAVAGAAWDPTSPQHSSSVLSTEAKRRVSSEMANYFKSPVDGIYMTPDEDDMSNFHAIVMGSKDTPYEGGMFYFYLKLLPDYPWKPPKVKLMTTANGTVRFNPNLYASGKVCLSILGTWAGPSWTPSLTLQSVLLSIQSLMNEQPFYNEPFYEGKQNNASMKKMSAEYTEDIRFHTIRVAVLDMVEGSNGDTHNLPEILKGRVESLFLEKFETYERIITENMGSTKFAYTKLKTRLYEVKKKIERSKSKKKGKDKA